MYILLFQEQYFIIKPNEVTTRSFKLYPTKDQAAKYMCTGDSTPPLEVFSYVSLILCITNKKMVCFFFSVCVAILKDSHFSEVDRAECQFSTTATVLDNGTQVLFLYSLVRYLMNVLVRSLSEKVFLNTAGWESISNSRNSS